jgi:hypothetical protein
VQNRRTETLAKGFAFFFIFYGVMPVDVKQQKKVVFFRNAKPVSIFFIAAPCRTVRWKAGMEPSTTP